MKTKIRHKRIYKKIQDRQMELIVLVDFLKDHRATPRRHRERFIVQSYSCFKTARAKLHAMFLGAMASDGGRSLTKSGKGSRQFFACIEMFGRRKKIPRIDFDEALNIKNSGLLESLDSFSGIGKKKAALFIRDLDVFERKAGFENKIFTNPRFFQRSEIQIPLDVVIADVLTKVLGLPKQYKIKPEDDFQLINEATKEIWGNGRMIFEDLWFWGYFGMRRDKKYDSRILQLNCAKWFTDRFVDPSNAAIMEEISCFVDLLSELRR